MMVRRLGILAVGLSLVGWLGAVASGCSPYKYEDDDETCSKAKPLPPTVIVRDDLDPRVGDKSDCKVIKYFKEANAKVEYTLGTAFEKHDIKGVISLYDRDGQVLDQKTVDPTIFRYAFEFKVLPNKPYYLEFKATEGKYGYAAQVQFQKIDPCAKCTEDQECVDEVCKDKVKVCDPECDEDEGFLCEEGECVYQCSSSCKRKNPDRYSCNTENGECERVTKKCKPRCKRGYYCNRRNGQCYQRKPRGCKPSCTPGNVCQKGKCVPLGGGNPCKGCAGKCDASTGFKCMTGGGTQTDGPITGRITSTVRAGGGTIVYVNRGKRHGVTRGKRGKLCGKFSITVTNVYATRSKAQTSASIEEIGGCKGVVISR